MSILRGIHAQVSPIGIRDRMLFICASISGGASAIMHGIAQRAKGLTDRGGGTSNKSLTLGVVWISTESSLPQNLHCGSTIKWRNFGSAIRMRHCRRSSTLDCHPTRRCIRPLRAQDRWYFGSLCSALAAAERPAVGPPAFVSRTTMVPGECYTLVADSCYNNWQMIGTNIRLVFVIRSHLLTR
jgi:hypothetical protein